MSKDKRSKKMKKRDAKPAPTLGQILAAEDKDAINRLGGLKLCRKVFEQVLTDRYGGCLSLKTKGGTGTAHFLAAVDKIRPALDGTPRRTSETDTFEFFTSESNRLIYALTRLDGECRNQELAMPREAFYSQEIARAWRNQITKKIKSDINDHPDAQAAEQALNDLYHEITA